ncbi:MAG: hypothetical protein K8Q99_05985 [Acholeplasmataceae bacterium]|nr:hypothetical protein [Acholeplasmataceae bacterium]
MRETELYLPVKNLLISQGFDVKAEVKDIDVLAMKDEFMLAVELKTKLSIKLIYQAIDRQKIVDQVYIALPKSAIKIRSASYRNLSYLLKRLEIGLILVDDQVAEVNIEANIYDMERSRTRYKKRKQQTLKEFRLRKFNKNTGGTRDKKITRYKESVIEIAVYMIEHYPCSPKEIKAATHIQKTASILQKNYEGYFLRVSRGLYQVNDDKIEEILKLKKLLKEGVSNENS